MLSIEVVASSFGKISFLGDVLYEDKFIHELCGAIHQILSIQYFVFAKILTKFDKNIFLISMMYACMIILPKTGSTTSP